MNDIPHFQKMTFRAFCDTDHKEKNADNSLQYEAIINPASISRSLGITLSNSKDRGAKDATGKTLGMNPETLSFELLFDGTGIVSDRKDVGKEIHDFLKVVYTELDDKKAPQYVEISYGTTIHALFQLTQLKLDYQLFHRDGSPLRVKAGCTFTRVAKPQKPDDDPKKNVKPPASSGKKQVPQSYDDLLSKAKETDCDSLCELYCAMCQKK